MTKEIFIIGIGGQGAQAIGDILMFASCEMNYKSSFYPFYGSQMRGGESGCIVKIDTDGNDIVNPTINSPDDFIILNDKFFDKYKFFSNDNSNYYLKKSINDKNANIKILKTFIDKTKIFDDNTIIESIKTRFKNPEVHNNLIEIYMKGEN